MKITIGGHACLYIETLDQRILVDPVFARELLGGAVRFSPPREFLLERMPPPTALVITHGHFDHFHPASVAGLARSTPVITAPDPEVLEPLRALGFTDLRILGPWEVCLLGQTVLEATPSDHDEPEFGLLVRDPEASFWHMVDSEVDGAVGERLLAEHGPIDVVASKYQPIAQSSMNHLRGLGSRVPKEAIFAGLEAACACAPRWVFPYAFGLCFAGRHAWFNRHVLAVDPALAARLLGARLGDPARSGTVQPGDVIQVDRSQVQHQVGASPFVRCLAGEAPAWEPIDPDSLEGLPTPAARAALRRDFEQLLRGDFARWLAAELEGDLAQFIELGVVWQFTVHAGAGERLVYAIDFRQAHVALRAGPHPEANYFVHVSGRTLADTLAGRSPELLFWLTGDARVYERILAVRDGRFWAPRHEGRELFERLPDPVTRYLRLHGGIELHVADRQPAPAVG
jgi:hypothetical protein